MYELEDIFWKSFKEWFENKNPKTAYGKVAELCRLLNIKDSSTLSNYKAGRRRGDEAMRRRTADVIGIPYDQMIGLKNDKMEFIMNELYELRSKNKKLNEVISIFTEIVIQLTKLTGTDPRSILEGIKNIETIEPLINIIEDSM